MKSKLSKIKTIAWLLLAALLLQFSLPILASVTDSDSGKWAEICTTSGTKWVQTDTEDNKSLPVSHAASDHCVFCSSTGAGAEFDASQHLVFHSIQSQRILTADHDLIVVFSGHAILSRAPPSYS